MRVLHKHLFTPKTQLTLILFASGIHQHQLVWNFCCYVVEPEIIVSTWEGK